MSPRDRLEETIDEERIIVRKNLGVEERVNSPEWGVHVAGLIDCSFSSDEHAFFGVERSVGSSDFPACSQDGVLPTWSFNLLLVVPTLDM